MADGKTPMIDGRWSMVDGNIEPGARHNRVGHGFSRAARVQPESGFSP
jgi:hypothetical protein